MLTFCVIVFFGGGIGALWAAIMGQDESLSGRIALAALGLLFSAGGVYSLLWAFRAKVILFPDRISIVGAFTTKAVLHSSTNSSGWRSVRDLCLVFQRKGERPRTVKLYLTFSQDIEFTEWLLRLRCLDAEEAEASENKILDDQRFGNTLSERSEALENGLKRTKVLNGISIAASLWALFYPRPYIPLMLVLVALPWVAAEMMRRSNGLIRADELRNDAHPNVALTWIMPACMLALRAVVDYDVLESAVVVIWCIAITGALSFAIFLGDATIRRKIGSIVFVLFTAAYGYGAAIEINGLRSRPEQMTYLAVVQSKRIDHGKHISYELELGPWGPETKENDLEVSKATYTAIQPGDHAVLMVRTGMLGVKWYYLRSWDHVPSAGATGGN